MADPKLVDILRQGGEVWNRWREQQSEDALIDLSGADLSRTKLIRARAALRGGSIYSACISSIDLYRVNLRGVNLSDADLSFAILIASDLRGTNLHGTNLREAKLSGADLRGADLIGANLSDAKLEHANWIDVSIGWTLFGNVDLHTVIGLKTVKHAGPSIIGLDTIYRSHGHIPEVFLRGAGVPETFITNMRALVDSMSPIEFYSCFISYSHQNEDFAKRLHADLQAQGVRCWFAEEDLKIGDHYHQRIDEAIRLYDKVILVLSDAAVQSAWVEREVVAAREKEDRQRREVLFPIRLDEAVMETEKAWAADVRRRWHIGDFTRWKEHDSYQLAFERLLRDLKAVTKGERNG